MSEASDENHDDVEGETGLAGGYGSMRNSDGSLEEAGAGARHSAREVALQVLYAVDLGETGLRSAQAARAARDETSAPGPAALLGRTRRPAPASAAKQKEELAEATLERARLDAIAALTPAEASDVAFARVVEQFDVPGSAVAFARILVAGVVDRTAELDELVGLHARNWRVSRMAAVDRNVLRLAVYELRDTDTPVAVVIDEAVDLARRFGSETSPAFVNGILDAIAREVRAA